MKTRTILIWLLLVLAGGSLVYHFSKPSKRSIFTKRATGAAHEVLVVMDKEYWNREAGKLLKKQLIAPISGLPQIEPSMRVTYAEPNQFNGLLRYVRNIIQVQIDKSLYTKITVSKEQDVWATGQELIRIYAPSEELLIPYLEEEGSLLVSYLETKERERYAAYLDESHNLWVQDSVMSQFQVQLFAPKEISSSKTSTDFFWATDHGRNGRTDFVLYSFPYIDERTFSLDYLVTKRDSVLGKQIKGAYPDSYMTTVKHLTPSYETVKLNHTYCGVVRGLWEMEGDMMGGPFVSYAYLDEKNQRIVVVETFVYAPNTDKAKFIRRGEAVLHTLRFMDTD